MPIEQYTYWSVTINNPDENDYLIVRNPNSKYIREIVWTQEEGGEEHTPHIQAWVRLQRNQGLAFMKKIYPRGHFKHCDKDEYNENCHQYAQKNDDTTVGNHHITLNDPLPANDTLLYKVLEKSLESLILCDDRMRDYYEHEGIKQLLHILTLKKLCTDLIEREMVMERSGLEKIFISPAYEKMKVKYWKEILLRIGHKQEDARGEDTETKSAKTHSDAETQTDQDSEGDSVSSCETDEDGGESVGAGSSQASYQSWS